jgi:hypothetical protein
MTKPTNIPPNGALIRFTRQPRCSYARVGGFEVCGKIGEQDIGQHICDALTVRFTGRMNPRP